MTTKPPSDDTKEGAESRGQDGESIDDSLNEILREANGEGGDSPPEEPGKPALEPALELSWGTPGETPDGMTPLDTENTGRDPEATTLVPGVGESEEAAHRSPAAADSPAGNEPMAAEASADSGPALVDDAVEENTEVEALVLAAKAKREVAQVPVTEDEATEAMAEAVDDADVLPAEEDVRPVSDTGGPGELTPSAGSALDTLLAAERAPGSVTRDDVIDAASLLVQKEEVVTVDTSMRTPIADPITADLSGNEPLTTKAREERDRALRWSAAPLANPPARPPARSGISPGIAVPKSADDRPSAEKSGEGSQRNLTGKPWPAPSTGSGRIPTPPSLPGGYPGRRLPTPGPGVAPPPLAFDSRASSPAIPIPAPSTSTQIPNALRVTSPVYSKIHLPVGGLVAVLIAAFGGGIVIGAVLWRGIRSDAAEQAAHTEEAAATATAAPAVVPAPATPTVPPEPSGSGQSATAGAAAEPGKGATPTAAAPAAEPAPPSSSTPTPTPASETATPATHAATASAPARRPAAALPAAKVVSTAKPKRPGTGAPAGAKPEGGKAKSAAWVDPFAE